MSKDVDESSQAATHALKFHGTGREYFSIWIVNLLLTVLTLGIYSAWAKVRRLRYLYGSAELAGARFEYHGEPLAILFGRVFALLLLVLYNWSVNLVSMWSLVIVVALLIALPWLLRSAIRFRMRYSSYRGLRFGFHGALGRAYAVFLLYPLFMVLTFYLAGPLFHQRFKQYQHGEASYGRSRFSFDAGVGEFYRTYAAIFGLSMLTVFLVGVAAAVLMPSGGDGPPDAGAAAMMTGVLFVLMIGASMMLMPLWLSRTQNLIWNRTRLAGFRFSSSLQARRVFWIYLTNALGIVLTLGLFTPWAVIRMARYRIESIAVHGDDHIEDFVAAERESVNAAGEEVTEIFDIDIGF